MDAALFYFVEKKKDHPDEKKPRPLFGALSRSLGRAWQSLGGDSGRQRSEGAVQRAKGSFQVCRLEAAGPRKLQVADLSILCGWMGNLSGFL